MTRKDFIEPLESRALFSSSGPFLNTETGTLNNYKQSIPYEIHLDAPGWIGCAIIADNNASTTISIEGNGVKYTSGHPGVLFAGNSSQTLKNRLQAGDYKVTVTRIDNQNGKQPPLKFTLATSIDYAGSLVTTCRDLGDLSSAQTVQDWVGSYDGMQDSVDGFTVTLPDSGVLNASVSFGQYKGEYLMLGRVIKGSFTKIGSVQANSAGVVALSDALPMGQYELVVENGSYVNRTDQTFTLNASEGPLVPKYVMCDLPFSLPSGTSASASANPDISFSLSPYNFRYGLWGGSGYSNGLEDPLTYDANGAVVDTMDALFRTHDNEYAAAGHNNALIAQADQELITGLKNLPTNSDGYYVSSPEDAPAFVTESVLVGGYNVAKEVPFSEFAREQAIRAFELKQRL